MDKPNVLSPDEIKAKLPELPGWQYEDDKIFKTFQFADFMDSLKFVNDLANYFETMDHHPDITIKYDKVLFELQRFDIGGKVTDRDIQVAQEIEKAYKNRE